MTHGRYVFGRKARTPNTTYDPVPLNPDDPVSAYILASKRSDDQRAEELRAAAKRGVDRPSRFMGRAIAR